MKAALILVTLSLVAFAQAKYELSCTKSELSIRWPSYESNSEYYVCSHLFGRQMTVTCNPGEVFTFVLQACTAPNRYIPAPALEALPTSSPLLNKPNKDGHLKPKEILNQSENSILETENVQEENQSESKEENNAVSEESIQTTMTTTTVPTTPLAEKLISKKPNASPDKTQSAKKKKSTVSDATTPVKGNKSSKKPANASAKKSAGKQNVKQNSKANKSSKKSVKKPKTTDKKSAKV